MADASDNRAVVVALTSVGREVGQRIVDASNSHFLLRAEYWTAADAEQFENLFIKLVCAMEATPGRPIATAAGISLETDPNLFAWRQYFGNVAHSDVSNEA